MSLAFKSWVMDEQEREENKMIEIQNFIDELKSISKISDKRKAINEIEQLIKKYQKIIDEHERLENESV